MGSSQSHLTTLMFSNFEVFQRYQVYDVIYGGSQSHLITLMFSNVIKFMMV